MKWKRRAAIGCLLVAVAAAPAWAWLRPQANWAELFDEAELIVVGHVVGDFVHVILQKEDVRPGVAPVWGHEGRLAIDEVLKGECGEAEIPIMLHYGLDPCQCLRDGKLSRGGWAHVYPGLPILDTGSSAMGPPVLVDARRPAIWFLGHYALYDGSYEPKPAPVLGVREPCHMQALKMLPLIRAILKPDGLDEQLAFLADPDEQVRYAALRYFQGRKDKRAFPLVAAMFADEELGVCAMDASVDIDPDAAIPLLRPYLADPASKYFTTAAYALGDLHDVESIPAMLEALSGAQSAFTRQNAAAALERMRDPTAIPGLIAALKDDGGPDDYWPGLWQMARRTIRTISGCNLSPNGDKAQRWWEAAQHLDRTAWQHFAAAEFIRCLGRPGPPGDVPAALRGRIMHWTGRPMPSLSAERKTRTAAVWWAQWLEGQGWNDYQALPSQIDDELSVTVEPTALLDSGEPVRLCYVVANVSHHELWVGDKWRELVIIRDSKGDRCLPHRPTRETGRSYTAQDFRRLLPSEGFAVTGDAVIHNDPERRTSRRPAWVLAGLAFECKGTSLGLDAWVGEVWAEPIHFPPPEEDK